jgi:hypothetical protein
MQFLKCVPLLQSNPKKKKKDSDAKMSQSNQKINYDATYIPADITYPTDLGLLNKLSSYRKNHRYPV